MTQELESIANMLSRSIKFVRSIIEHRNFLFPKRSRKICGLNCIEDNHDFYKLCNSLDVLEDVMEAFFFYFNTNKNVRKSYGFGETYLRFYGLVSAAYSQKNAIYGISILFGLQKECECLDELMVIQIRNTVLVHFTKNKKQREESYSVSRGDLTQGRVVRSGNGTNEGCKLIIYDLDEAISEWMKNLNQVICTIIPSIIDNLDQYFDKEEILNKFAELKNNF